MPFEFVDNATIDRKARKLIRSHAAKGKNLGRTLNRPSRQNKESHCKWIVKTQESMSTPRGSADDAPEERDRDEELPMIERQLGDGMSVYALPTELRPGTRRLTHEAFAFLNIPPYPVEISDVIDFNGTLSMWIQFMFMDEAYFHCTVAMALAAIGPAILTQEESLRHVTRTFRLVNSKLSGKDALSDTSMAAVIAMTHYERTRDRYRQSLIHFDGLQRMIGLSGGISWLATHKPGICQKVFRGDLEFALQLGGTTRYGVEELSGHATVGWIRGLFMKNRHWGPQHPSLFARLSDSLREVFEDVMSVAWFLNNSAEHGTKLDGYTFHDVTILIGYKLIRIGRLDGPRTLDRLENAVHLGLLAFMKSFIMGLGGKRPENPLLSRLVRSAAQDPIGEDEESNEVLAWLLFVSRASPLLTQADDEWVIERLEEANPILGLQTWEEVRRVLSRFPWVSALHDEPGKALWQAAKPQRDNLGEYQYVHALRDLYLSSLWEADHIW